ncbi:hypothetical protein BDN67DRAFT_976745 [Paxillus ammoniavirescens]|nr:hypothetical protein BDN67DRAFT_976745 [Paxillus ammoniavirescens]
METWLVSERCLPHLQELFESHDICPLPTFDKNNKCIPPRSYQDMLQGATVEVYFTYGHHFIRKAKRHVYGTILRHLRVLRAPAKLPSSPFKRARVSATTKTKGKSRAY